LPGETQFVLNYQQQYSWSEFIALNQIACQVLENLD